MKAIYNRARDSWELGYAIGGQFHIVARYPA